MKTTRLNISQLIKISLSVLALSLVLTSCKKDVVEPSSKKATNYMYAVQMTNVTDSKVIGLNHFDAVYVDVQSIEVKGDNGSVVTINTVPAIYNLLNLTNGTFANLATAAVKGGHITEIKLILGKDNMVAINGTSHTLTLPAQYKSGFCIPVDQSLLYGEVYTAKLNFDAYSSVIVDGADYKLVPAIKAL